MIISYYPVIDLNRFIRDIIMIFKLAFLFGPILVLLSSVVTMGIVN